MVNKKLSDIAIKMLDLESKNCDTEIAHLNADDTLCRLLEELGYKEVVEKYKQVPKWHA